jgi:hypothetical protein
MIGREHFKASEYSNLLELGMPSADRMLEKLYRTNPLRAHIAATYLKEMRGALSEIERVLKPNGHLILVVADNSICGKSFPTHTFLSMLLKELGFELRLEMVDCIRSRGFITKRNSTANLITKEWVLVFRK